MREVARSLKPLLASQLVVTIAAGIRIADLSRWLGGYRRIVRVMPNTPALVHAGISGLYASAAVGAADRAAAGKILGAVGRVLWLKREEDLDAVTAVSGSGPAYVFYFIEALERAARDLGLAAQAAHDLAIETFAGAVKLAAQASEPPEILRGRVTSKGGAIEYVHWATGTARLLPRLLRGRTSGPVFLAGRRAPVSGSRVPAEADVCPETGRGRLSYPRAEYLFKQATAAHDPHKKGWTLHQLRHFVPALFPCRDSRHQRKADLRPALLDHLLLAAACRGTPRDGSVPAWAGQLRHGYH